MYTKEHVEEKSLQYFKGDKLASNTFTNKYALKARDGSYLEETPRDMHVRLAKEFARMEAHFGGPNAMSYEEIFNYLDQFKEIVPQGSPMQGIGNDQVLTSLSNCMVVAPPEDNVSSILDTGKKLANLFKRRCGVGVDISNLRPDGAFVNNAAMTSSGAWSFSDFFSYVTRMMCQFGRRGALLISMGVRHPDIFKFVRMKQDKTSVTGANVSIKITDDFMEAVKNDDDFELRFPIDAPPEEVQYRETIKARDLWMEIITSATETAEPGLFMWDNILKMLPAECYQEEGFITLSTNPCGEIPLSVDSCRLISICLKWFVKNPFQQDAYFDFPRFRKVVRAAMRLSDDLVSLEIEKLNNILANTDIPDEQELWQDYIDSAEKGRRTGLGTHALADAIARLCLRYDSEEGLKMMDKIYGTLKECAYQESVNLAKERGAFPVFNWEKEKDNLFILGLSEGLRKQIQEHGRRNISILTNAPTGSVSIMSQTSSGIEPVFRNAYKRKRKIGHNEEGAEVTFVDAVGDHWTDYIVYHHNVQEWMNLGLNKEMPDYFVESDQIDWNRRVELQGIIQSHIDHSISSTINLPRGTKPEVVAALYEKAWEHGLKGVTVYVEGSRDGVLTSIEEEAKEGFHQHDAPKRPEDLDCDIYFSTIKGNKWIFLVGMLDGKPYEVMGGLLSAVGISQSITSGKLHKREFKRTNKYDLYDENGDLLVKDIIKAFDNPNYGVQTRMISLALRHGTKPNFLAEQLLKDPTSDFNSFSRVVARILKKYVEDGTSVSSDKVCSACDTESLIYMEGCVICQNCGNTKCG